MTTADAWTDRLSDYLDGELTASEERALGSHLQECAACRTNLEELRAIVASLASDPITARDQPTLEEWLAIRRALRVNRRRWIVPAAIAASVIVILTVGGGLFSLRPGKSEPPHLPTVRVPVMYREASLDLEAVLQENRSRLSPGTLRALEASLMTVDSAIAEAERALIADPANDYVTRHVVQLHDARLLTLRQAVNVALLRN